MTKTEFGDQFKRLRAAGYRLPVGDGITVKDVIDEWYGTFGSCAVAEFAHAIDCLKRTKPDTFWPACGELWTHILQYRKERRIQREANDQGYAGEPMSDEGREAFLVALREFGRTFMAKKTMPDAEPQVEPDHVRADEDVS